eukprot:Blabericola_migrator_1__5691@NODE_288_length_10293_cov_65_527675_g237_i0_p6_GENE_NODE_288_length_10293_cov_65_527675_g237_i0NODE_288_length_10293_cov_65_527675_g237_i0_p6_ORF_typecomplete_len163_score41_29Eapp_C/PF10238_9/0_0067HECT_2/PF09814_9/0_01YippeeMis18/PF03226_14/0_068_NODE_288_length_10293_cov_65_527675_g237_i089439431
MEEDDDWVPVDHHITLEHKTIDIVKSDVRPEETLYSEEADKLDEEYFTHLLEDKNRVLVSCGNCFGDLALDPTSLNKSEWEVQTLLPESVYLQPAQSDLEEPSKKQRLNDTLTHPTHPTQPVSKLYCAQCQSVVGGVTPTKTIRLKKDCVFLHTRAAKAPVC